MKCGLLGRKLGHSYSPQIHRYLGDYTYELFEREPCELDGFFSELPFDAINVTIPYKETVMGYCKYIDPSAVAVGSVNTLVKRGGELYGYNTDYFGFKLTLTSVCDVSGKKVLVLGSGGSSKTVTAVVKDLGGTPVIISRSGENNYENIERHCADTAVIVNTTPVGMYPSTLVSPVVLDGFKSLSAVIDIIYNPAKTKLLLDAERLGIPYKNGLYMLVAQAKCASEYFSGGNIPDSVIEDIVKNIKRELLNVVLVGMPGCGKSRVGEIVAKLLGREFVDIDTIITNRFGKTPAEIITDDGEASFRKIETEVMADIAKRSSLVIATGGGAVTVGENYNILRQNSLVIWLMRKLENLSKKGRPLSQSGSIEALYEKRAPMYERFSDISVMSTEDKDLTAEKIAEIFKSSI